MGSPALPPCVMEVSVLILLLMGEQLSAAPPDVFDDYFEQDVKAVHLSQRGVIKACLPENKWKTLLEKFESANTACEGGNADARFDWATLAKLNQGGDGDGNGVEFNLESAEGCLYRQLEWTDGTKLKAANVKADFEGLPSSVLTRFEADLKECYNWNGEFKKKKRKKREVGEEEADAGIARLPANLLNWARELLPRVKRSAESGLKRRKRASIRGRGKGKSGKSGRSGKSGKSGKKSRGKKSGKRKKKGKKSNKKKKKSKSKGGSKSSEKSGGSGLDQEVYNQLWC